MTVASALLLVVATLVAVVSAHSRFGEDFVPPRWQDMTYHTEQYGTALRAINDRIAASAEDAEAYRHAKKMTCPECVIVATALQAIGENKTDAKDAKDAIDLYCDLHFALNESKKKACLSAGGIVLDIVPVLVKGLKSLAWDIPITVCSNLLFVCQQPCCKADYTPEQIHLSFGDEQPEKANSTMTVTWVTLKAAPGASVLWRQSGTTAWNTAAARGRTYSHGGWVGWNNIASMTGLMPNTTYEYVVGDANVASGVSATWTFTTLPSNVGSPQRPLRVVSIADMGWAAASNDTVARIEALVRQGEVDFVLHNGDIGYADADEPHWGIFFNKIQHIAASVPYMTTPGNHEFYWNFSAYRNRLAMPPASYGAPEGAMWYRFEAGGFEFAMIDSESVIDTPYIETAQRDWIKDRFSAANAAGRPIIASLHRGVYCTGLKLQCGLFSWYLRGRLESLFFDHKVAYVNQAHTHNYERSYPLHDNDVVQTNYTNPTAPMYVVNGAAGNREGNQGFHYHEAWNAWRTREVGFVTLEMTRSAAGMQIQSRFVRSSDGDQLDSFTLTRNG